jgi:hypothetical protein
MNEFYNISYENRDKVANRLETLHVCAAHLILIVYDFATIIVRN